MYTTLRHISTYKFGWPSHTSQNAYMDGVVSSHLFPWTIQIINDDFLLSRSKEERDLPVESWVLSVYGIFSISYFVKRYNNKIRPLKTYVNVINKKVFNKTTLDLMNVLKEFIQKSWRLTSSYHLRLCKWCRPA